MSNLIEKIYLYPMMFIHWWGINQRSGQGDRETLLYAGYFEAPGAMVYPLGSSLQPFNPQPVTIVFCNMDNLSRMKV